MINIKHFWDIDFYKNKICLTSSRHLQHKSELYREPLDLNITDKLHKLMWGECKPQMLRVTPDVKGDVLTKH